MALVTKYSQIQKNLDYLESEQNYKGRDHSEFVKLGICFVTYIGKSGVSFAPSRFIGYVDNSFETHATNADKDGRDTNPEITTILGSQPKSDAALEALYKKFCLELGFQARPKGSFGVERKFWDCRKR